MSLDMYTSEVLKYHKITLGSAEAMFLNKLMGEPKSAYAVSANLKKSGRSMAYKNVYTRIKRLEELNLIEKVPEKFPRGAIYYRLTTQGLMYQISRFVNIDETLMWSDFLDFYSEHIIFKTLVLPYFEVDTINHANATLYFAITLYLGDCYQITLDAADRIRKAIEERNETDKEYYTKRLKKDLEWQPRAFAFRLVTDFPTQKGGGVILGSLAKDWKFMKLLTEVYKDLDKAFATINKIHNKYYNYDKT